MFCGKDICHLHARTLAISVREQGLAIAFSTSGSVQLIKENSAKNLIFCLECWKERRNTLNGIKASDQEPLRKAFIEMINKYALTKSL